LVLLCDRSRVAGAKPSPKTMAIKHFTEPAPDGTILKCPMQLWSTSKTIFPRRTPGEMTGDGRSAQARRFRRLVAGFEAELGTEALTGAERTLAEQAALLTMKHERSCRTKTRAERHFQLSQCGAA
jgi:hypothetical protein